MSASAQKNHVPDCTDVLARPILGWSAAFHPTEQSNVDRTQCAHRIPYLEFDGRGVIQLDRLS